MTAASLAPGKPFSGSARRKARRPPFCLVASAVMAPRGRGEPTRTRARAGVHPIGNDRREQAARLGAF